METGIVFGRIPVLEYLKSDLPNNKTVLLISEHSKESSIKDIISNAKKLSIRIEKIDKLKLIKLCGDDQNIQGVALKNCPLYHEPTDSELKVIADKKGTIVVLDQITDPHNAGAIIRSAEALGAAAVVMTKANSVSINGTTIKSSAGATAFMPVLMVTNLARSLDDLKNLGFWIVGSSDRGDSSIEKIKEFAPAAIVIGSEGDGMRQLTEKKCDLIVRIELAGKVNSLNASVAAALLIHEAVR